MSDIEKINGNDSAIKGTNYLRSIPKMQESIIEGMNTPLEECLKVDALQLKNKSHAKEKEGK